MRDALLVGVTADEKQHVAVDIEFRFQVSPRRFALREPVVDDRRVGVVLLADPPRVSLLTATTWSDRLATRCSVSTSRLVASRYGPTTASGTSSPTLRPRSISPATPVRSRTSRACGRCRRRRVAANAAAEPANAGDDVTAARRDAVDTLAVGGAYSAGNTSSNSMSSLGSSCRTSPRWVSRPPLTFGGNPHPSISTFGGISVTDSLVIASNGYDIYVCVPPPPRPDTDTTALTAHGSFLPARFAEGRSLRPRPSPRKTPPIEMPVRATVRCNSTGSVACFAHVPSLPGPHGIGDLGDGARAFVDCLDRPDQSLWQFCPLGPTASIHGNSPYQSSSAFAGNPLLIDLRDLTDRGYLTEADTEPPDDFSGQQVNYDRVTEFKEARLRDAYAAFEESASDADQQSFAADCEREAGWLDDYALFTGLKAEFDDAGWMDWPDDIERASRRRSGTDDLCDDIRHHRFDHWCSTASGRRWPTTRPSGTSASWAMPIYVGLDSADVWAIPRVPTRRRPPPAEVAGVPPNPGDDGQRWGTRLRLVLSPCERLRLVGRPIRAAV